RTADRSSSRRPRRSRRRRAARRSPRRRRTTSAGAARRRFWRRARSRSDCDPCAARRTRRSASRRAAPASRPAGSATTAWRRLLHRRRTRSPRARKPPRRLRGATTARSAPLLLLLEEVLELLERLLLQARDVHLGDVEAIRDLGLRDALVEAQVQNDALAAGEHLEGALEVGAVFEQLQPGVVLPDVVRERLRLLVAFAVELGVEREEVVRLAQLLRFQNVFLRCAEMLRQLGDGRRMTELHRQLLDGAVDREVQLLQPARHLDRPALVAEIALDLADDRRRRVRRELHAALEIEAVDRLEQADGADLDQVVERFAAVGELDGEIAHQVEVRDDQLVPQPVELTDPGMVGSAVESAIRTQLREARERLSRPVTVPPFLVDVRNRG